MDSSSENISFSTFLLIFFADLKKVFIFVSELLKLGLAKGLSSIDLNKVLLRVYSLKDDFLTCLSEKDLRPFEL